MTTLALMAIVSVQSKAELHPAFVLSPKEAKSVEKRGFEDGHFVNGPKRRIDAGVKVVEGKLGSVVIYTPRLLAYSRGYANGRNEEDSRVVFVFAPSLMPPSCHPSLSFPSSLGRFPLPQLLFRLLKAPLERPRNQDFTSGWSSMGRVMVL